MSGDWAGLSGGRERSESHRVNGVDREMEENRELKAPRQVVNQAIPETRQRRQQHEGQTAPRMNAAEEYARAEQAESIGVGPAPVARPVDQ